MTKKLISEEALQKALMCYGDIAFRICYMHTKSPKAARDLLEDVFMQYCLHTKPFSGEEDELNWLLRTTHKVCMDYYAAKLRKNPADAQIQEAGKDLDFVITDELCLIMKLPYTALTPLALCFGDEYSEAAAARIVGRSAAFVSKQLKKAIDRTKLPENEVREWIQTIYMPDDIRSRLYYNIINTAKDKHFGINSRAQSLKRNVDRAIPYVALGVICFGVLAVAAVRFGWLGVEYVRTPMTDDTASGAVSSAVSDSTASTSSAAVDGDSVKLSLSYYVPDGDGLVLHYCTMEGDATGLIAKMAENGAFPTNVELLEIRYLKGDKLAETLKSGDMPDVQLYFNDELQATLNAETDTITLEAIARTMQAFYDAANIIPAKLEIFSNGRPVTINGEEVNCTPLLYGESTVNAILED